jgi:hypothetical protein
VISSPAEVAVRILILALPLLATLAACDTSGTTIVVRSKSDGEWIIDSRVRINGGIAQFECLHSATRRCHYTLFPAGCTSSSGSTRCSGQALDQFSMAVDSTRALSGLSDFKLCVSHRPGQMRPDCTLQKG